MIVPRGCVSDCLRFNCAWILSICFHNFKFATIFFTLHVMTNMCRYFKEFNLRCLPFADDDIWTLFSGKDQLNSLFIFIFFFVNNVWCRVVTFAKNWVSHHAIYSCIQKEKQQIHPVCQGHVCAALLHSNFAKFFVFCFSVSFIWHSTMTAGIMCWYISSNRAQHTIINSGIC